MTEWKMWLIHRNILCSIWSHQQCWNKAESLCLIIVDAISFWTKMLSFNFLCVRGVRDKISRLLKGFHQLRFMPPICHKLNVDFENHAWSTVYITVMPLFLTKTNLNMWIMNIIIIICSKFSWWGLRFTKNCGFWIWGQHKLCWIHTGFLMVGF